MSEPIRKRHPRLAVWRARAFEYSIPVAAFGVALVNALSSAWDEVPAWLLVGIIALVYQIRLQSAWLWGWREGQEETLRRMMPHVQVDASNIEELHEALEVDAPSWRQRQDEMSQIDYLATVKASMERLERMSAETDEHGPK